MLAVASLLGGFVWVERHALHPMLDLSLSRSRVFTAAALSALLNYIAVYAVAFLLAFYLIQFRGYSPGAAGLLLATQALVMAVIAPLSGWLSDRVGSRALAAAGMAVLTAGLLSLGMVDVQTTPQTIATLLALIGLGTGLFVWPNNSALLRRGRDREWRWQCSRRRATWAWCWELHSPARYFRPFWRSAVAR